MLYLDAYLRPNLKKKDSLDLDVSRLYGKTNGFFKDNTSDPAMFASYNATAFNSSMSVDKLDWDESPDKFITNKSNRETLSSYIKSEMYGAVFRKLSSSSNSSIQSFDLEVWFNNEASHSLPLSISSIYNTLFEYENHYRLDEFSRIEFTNEPFINPLALFNIFAIVKDLKVMWKFNGFSGVTFFSCFVCNISNSRIYI